MLSRITSKLPSLRTGLLGALIKTPVLASNAKITPRFFASSAYQELEQKFSKVLENEIGQESSAYFENSLPHGFSITKEEGQLVEISKSFSDGCTVSVEINLAGSVSPDFESENQTKDNISTRPDIDIKLKKSGSKSIIFHCMFPEQQETTEESSCMIIESVELESIPGYFIYADVFDDTLYEHILGLLTERGLDEKFQEELQAFCNSKEHSLYIKFLKDIKAFCEAN